MESRNMKFNEEKLIEIVRPYFKTARAGDWKHALRVVKWVKELGRDRADLYLLITAAYIHDIGWSGVAPKGKIDLDEMLKIENKANKNSSKLIAEVLKKIEFTDSGIQTVNRFVAAANRRESEQEDEVIIVDADNLSKLCLGHLSEKYQPESFSKLIKHWETELPNRIKTERGKELFPKLLEELKKTLRKKSCGEKNG